MQSVFDIGLCFCVMFPGPGGPHLSRPDSNDCQVRFAKVALHVDSTMQVWFQGLASPRLASNLKALHDSYTAMKAEAEAVKVWGWDPNCLGI